MKALYPVEFGRLTDKELSFNNLVLAFED